MYVSNAAGILTSTNDVERWIDIVKDSNRDNVNMVVSKTCTWQPVEYRPGIGVKKYISTATYSAIINRIGLINRGVQRYVKEFESVKDKHPWLITVISVYPCKSLDKSCKYLHQSLIDMVELNVGCPNNGRVLGYHIDELEHIIQIYASKCNKPYGLKLPFYPAEEFVIKVVDMIDHLSCAKPTYIVCCNTIAGYTPQFGNGGVSGITKVMAMANVKWFRTHLDKSRCNDIAILGCGGIQLEYCSEIESNDDVVDYIDCGADGVQLGTTLYRYLNRAKL